LLVLSPLREEDWHTLAYLTAMLGYLVRQILELSYPATPRTLQTCTDDTICPLSGHDHLHAAQDGQTIVPGTDYLLSIVVPTVVIEKVDYQRYHLGNS
jgi:hypothetical protein